MALNEQYLHQEVTQGKYALSIPTSLAIETLFGLNDNIKPTNPLPYTHYDYLTINVLTLIRNLYGSVEKALKQEWSASHYLSHILKELENIPLIIDNQSHGRIQTFFYIPTYRSLQREYPHAFLKGMGKKAYGRQHYEAIEQYIVAQLTAQAIREGQDKTNLHLIDTRLPPPPKDARVLIMTHQPIDLVPYTEIKNPVALLESHTGLIKDRYQWYTKLGSKGEGIEHIPFAKWSVQWFGDGKLLTAYPARCRRAVLDFAIEQRWNQSTADRVVQTQLKRFPDPEIRADILKLFR